MIKPAVSFACVLAFAVVASGCFFNVTSYKDTDGSIVYVGEVSNDGPPLDSPVVEGTFYDANGNVIATQKGYACRVMPTKSVAAFKVTLPPGTAQPARADWKLTGHVVDNPYLAEGLSGQLFGSGPPLFDKPSLYGEMKNNSASTYFGGYGCVAWVNARGEVLRVADVFAAGLRFGPGGTLPFAVNEDVPPDATAAVFFLDAGVTPPGQTPFTIVDMPLSAFKHTTHRSLAPLSGTGSIRFAFGEIQNTGATPLAPDLIAVTRDSAGHPNGVGSSEFVCDVPAFPGTFTFAGYFMASAAPVSQPAEERIEAVVVNQPTSLKQLAVSGVAFTTGSTPLVHVTGTVKNVLSQTVTTVYICAAVYDSAGNVIGVSPETPTLPAGGLAPGATISFSVDVLTFGTTASVKAIAAGAP